MPVSGVDRFSFGLPPSAADYLARHAGLRTRRAGRLNSLRWRCRGPGRRTHLGGCLDLGWCAAAELGGHDSYHRYIWRLKNDLKPTGADGVPTQHRRKWHPSTIWDLYRNRFYTGRSKFDGTWVQGQHRAIVSDELFRRANAGNGGAGSRRR